MGDPRENYRENDRETNAANATVNTEYIRVKAEPCLMMVIVITTRR